MEGNPADLTVYKDTDYSHDHTYFGNGCNTGDGSKTPCATRILKDGDSEDQKNGTYYHFQAATSGSGFAVTTQNAIVPDSFCPLGWQLPYNGTGGDYYDKSRSWYYLFTTYNIGFNDGTSEDAAKIKKYPFSYINSGDFRWESGHLYYQNITGYYMSSAVGPNGHDLYRIGTWWAAVRVYNPSNKGNGSPIRCVTRKKHPRKAPHGIRVHSLVLWLFIF